MEIFGGKPWPENAWYVGAWSHEVQDKPFPRTICNEAMVFFRDADGKVAALEDRCCHRAVPLRLGEVVPEGLQCGYHGLIYDGTGKCVKVPGQDKIAPKTRVRSFPVVERQEFIWVWMGDPALADESKLIDYPFHDDHEKWPHKHGLLHVKCNYVLLVDNLMDLTHIPYIHRKTIGGGNTQGQVDATMDVTPTEAGVHYIRWMIDIQPPPTYVKAAGFADSVKVDRWQEFEYVAPMSVLQWTGALAHGKGAKENRDQPGGFQLRIYHGATPETDETCHYFFTPLNGCDVRDETATQKVFDEIYNTFLEDLEYLDAQQECMAATLDKDLINIKHDAARVSARKALERMIAAEIGTAQAAE